MNIGEKMSENIKIFVSNRIDKECETIQGNTFVPVRCGACFDKNEAPSIIGDDTGDNISGKRLSLCELTVQYWAWKNAVEDAEYVGLCHYRRYFSFSKFHFAKSPYGLVREKYIDEDSISRHCLDDEHIAQMVKERTCMLRHQLRNVP